MDAPETTKTGGAMSSKNKNRDLNPCLVVADESGNIYDEPELLMLVRRGEQWGLPRPDELVPLPRESELFLLPGRKAVGYNAETGEAEEVDGLAVAAFAAPGYTPEFGSKKSLKI